MTIVHQSAREPVIVASRDDRGSVLVPVVVMLVLVAGFVFSLFHTTIGSSNAMHQNVLSTQLLYVAESALSHNSVTMSSDPLYAVKDTGTFKVDGSAQEYVSSVRQLTTSSGKVNDYVLRVRYLQAGVPVVFADRSDPVEPWSTLRVEVSAAAGGVERRVVGFYGAQMSNDFAAALVSDMVPTGPIDSGKTGAGAGHIVFNPDGKTQWVYGDINSNGDVVIDDKAWSIGHENSELGGIEGDLNLNLAGTAEEIPDFTSPGSSEQLFDLDRFEAVAKAGSGEVFTTINDFIDAQNDANDGLRAPLEGMIVLKVDSAAEGSDPKIEIAASKTGHDGLPGGINIAGTLMWRFSDGTDASYKVFVVVPLNINAADLTGFDATDPNTFDSGYPGTYADASNQYFNADITPYGFSNFTSSDDLPALCFNTGIVDMHDPVNICGMVYGPSFIEIENMDPNLQYINGVILGGGGIYVKGHSGGEQVFNYDSSTVDSLATLNNQGMTLAIRGFTILK